MSDGNDDDLKVPVIAGIGAGIFLIALFSFYSSSISFHPPSPPLLANNTPGVSTVIIPKDFSNPDGAKNFEPPAIKVVIDVNNTVSWVNQDVTRTNVIADANVADDSSFYIATNPPASRDLSHGESLKFTFNKPGEFAYHSGYHTSKNGTVVVLPEEYRDFESYKPKISEVQAVRNVEDYVNQRVQYLDLLKVYGLRVDGETFGGNAVYYTIDEFIGGKITLPLRYYDYNGDYYLTIQKRDNSYNVVETCSKGEPCYFLNIPFPKGRLVYIIDAYFHYAATTRSEDYVGATGAEELNDRSSFFLVDAMNGEILYSSFQ